MKTGVEVRYCKPSELEATILLSKSCLMKFKGSSVVELGIHKPVTEDDYENLIVAATGGKIIGCLVLYNTNEEDKEWYNLDENSDAMSIMRISVDKNFRGKGIAGKMINFAIEKANGKDIYVDIMAKPAQNINSKNAFEKSGFKLVEEKYWFYESKNMQTSWWIYVYKNSK